MSLENKEFIETSIDTRLSKLENETSEIFKVEDFYSNLDNNKLKNITTIFDTVV